MLTTLLALLSSGGFGSIIGLAGGILNRKIDIASKREEHDFELKKLDKQKEYLELEYKSRTAVATIEAEGAVEAAGYEALSKSYDFAKTTSEDGLVDRVSKAVRPLLTIGFFVLTILIFWEIHKLAGGISSAVDPKEIFSLYKQVLEWIFFQAGVAIGWWFAMRPGKVPTFK